MAVISGVTALGWSDAWVGLPKNRKGAELAKMFADGHRGFHETALRNAYMCGRRTYENNGREDVKRRGYL